MSYSSIADEQLQQWVQLLGSLMSTDNAQRKAAEDFYEQQMQQHATIALQALLECFSRSSVPTHIRSFAGVLLRRAIEKYSGALPPAAMQQFREQLLFIWAQESQPLLLQRLSHAMAQSALKTEWNELIPRMVQHAQSQQSAAPTVIPILNLIEIIADYCPEDIASNLALLGQFLGRFIAAAAAGGDSKLRIACAKATAACIVALEEESQRDAFKPAIDPLLAVLGLALTEGEELEATKLVDYFVTVAQTQPLFFKNSVDAVAGAMLSIANAHHLDFSTRSAALEWLLTISEAAPAMARRCAPLVQGLVPLILSLMLEAEQEEEEWTRCGYCDEDSGNSEEEQCALGDEAVERIAAGLGGKTIADAVLSLAQQFMSNSSSWRHRRAAVASISRLAEGSAKHFKSKYFADALNFLSLALQDPSPRVKFEGAHAIGRFAVLYADNSNNSSSSSSCSGELLQRFLPPLTSLLQDVGTCDRVRGHAAAALIDLINPDHCDCEVLLPLLDPLLQALMFCLQSAPLTVRSPCLSLLGCIAQVAGDDFAPYYNSFMPGIKSVLREATSPELLPLRGKAMECAGLVGEAVNQQLFAADAAEIMQLFAAALARDSEKDAAFEFILPACARISRALGAQFEAYLPLVMQPLLAAAAVEIQFTMSDAEEDAVEGEVTHDEDNGTESAVVSFGAGVKKLISLNTHAVQQKNQAARCLYEFADALKGNLKSYALPTINALLLLLAEKHSADIRSSAALAIGKAFDAFINALQLGYLPQQQQQQQQQQWEEVLSECVAKLLQCLRAETDETARACAAETLRDVLQSCYHSGSEQADCSRSGYLLCPSIPACENIVSQLLLHCQESLSRRACKVRSIADNCGFDDDDKEAAAAELEEEEELLTTLADAMGQLLKLHGAAFMPTFDALIAPAFSPFLQQQQPEALQVVAVYLLDDAIEFGGPSAHKYISSVLPTFLRNSQSKNALLRQSSVYGIAKALFVAPDIMQSQLQSVLPVLLSILHDPALQQQQQEEADEEDSDSSEGIFENAVFAVGSVCTLPQYRTAVSAMGNVADLAKVWLQFLPLKSDELSAKIASNQLCDAVERGDSVVLGADVAHLQDILRVIADVFIATNAATAAATAATGVAGPSPNSVALLAEDGNSSSSSSSDVCGAVAHPDAVRRLQNIARGFSAQIPAQRIQDAFAALSQQQQQALKAVL